MVSPLEPLARRVAAALIARQEFLATAESCTGGLVAQVLTDIPGSSAWFDRGLVTYSNLAKQQLLDVPAQLIEQHGAVSEECARAMAQGLLGRAPVQWTLAVTGIAGPTGGSAAKPVGTVWIAWGGSAIDGIAQRFHFDGDRSAVRLQSAQAALVGLLERIGA